MAVLLGYHWAQVPKMKYGQYLSCEAKINEPCRQDDVIINVSYLCYKSDASIFHLYDFLCRLHFSHFCGIPLHHSQDSVAVTICHVTPFPVLHFVVITLQDNKS